MISYNEFGLPKLAWRYPWVHGITTSCWFWEGTKAPQVDTLVNSFVEVLCRNGNFIISFPQLADGTVPEDHMDVLRELGKWVRMNESGIFGTRPWRMLGEGPTTIPYERGKPHFFQKDDIRFTRKDGVTYAFLMNPAEANVTLKRVSEPSKRE